MAIFWSGLVVMLAASVLLWKRIRRNPGLLMLHAGCILIIAGAMWGSQTAHDLRAELWGDTRLHHGEGILSLGESINVGFEVKLEKAWTEYYPPTGSPWDFYYELRIPDGAAMGIPLQWEDPIKKPLGKFTVPGQDFRGDILEIYTDDKSAASAPELFGRALGPNVKMEIFRDGKPATIRFKARDDSNVTRIPPVNLYDSQAAWEADGYPAIVMYNTQAVKDHKAVLSIHENGKEVLRKTIEVNYPLHYGGYHFYLMHCDPAGKFVELTVRSDAGLYVVYAGMILLCVGVFVVMWGKAIFRWLLEAIPKTFSACK
ncbi:MAG: cytochrome c biogenesis protein ResB [Phycisphaerae bacterium]|nr:cytochrome c biogenesis protein ResB [Phycisphaerae bacterium]